MNLVETDSRVGQQRRRVRGDQYLPAGFRVHPRHEARQVSHEGVVQGQLGFFQQQRATPFRQRPEQPDQAQRAVRERAFVLARRALPPVAETRFQMPATACILLKRQAVELRNGDLQRLVDVAEPRVARLGRCRGDFLEKVASERIVVPADGPFGITHQMGHDVEIPDGLQEFGKFAKVLVHDDLLEVRLRQPFRGPSCPVPPAV